MGEYLKGRMSINDASAVHLQLKRMIIRESFIERGTDGGADRS
jgi:hypothetical protein